MQFHHLAVARGRLRGAEFVGGSLLDLPVRDASADVVVTGLALTHVEDLTAAYAELARIVRSGGTVVVSDAHPELVRRGSAVKGIGPGGQPVVAATHVHTVGDHVRAALAAGLAVHGLTEDPQPGAADGEADERAEPVLEVGDWRWWPWDLLGRDPEAAAVAWDVPMVIVLHLERGS